MSIDSDIEAWMVLLAFLEKSEAPIPVYEAVGWLSASGKLTESRREAFDRLRGAK